ncbi:MAG TPA: Gfo/Idh/MocA family oxidoreductase [Lacisediminihabitans sp.]|uniref:Gfo/Idh/MocA family protein n=1 Tax=Lacisediminihabitans sp. TaxID=2787631 RepID=UPI002EDA4047
MRIGFAGIVHVHAIDYAASLRRLGHEVVGAFDADAVALAAWCARSAVPASSLEDLLESAEAMIVTSATNEHLTYAVRIASAGLPILMEKPLATSLPDAAEIVRVCAEAGVTLMTALPMRFSAAAIGIREWMAGGAAGDVLCLSGVNQSLYPAVEADWFADAERAGGGAVMDHVVHLADLYSWWLDAAPTRVHGTMNSVLYPDAGVDTACLVTLRYPGGQLAIIDASWSRPQNDVVFGTFAVTITCGAGVVDVDAMADHVVVVDAETSRTSWIFASDGPAETMLAEFVAAALEDREPSVTGADGLRASAVALAARDSWRAPAR